MNNIVLFHASCLDGTGAAFAAHKYFSELSIVEPVKYIPVQYSEPFPDVPLCENTAVYILDFSYDRQTLIDIHAKVGKLVVLDHHKTAQEALAGLDFAYFDIDKSGAVLAWEYFHPGKPLPDLMRYIQDRDLWKFELPGTKPLFSALMNRKVLSEPINKEGSVLSKLIDRTIVGHGFDKLIREGKLLETYRDNLIESYGKAKGGKLLLTQMDGLKVAVFNLTFFISEAGTLVYNMLDVDFSMSYFITPGGRWVFSLRSKSDKADVSVIAKKHGGGGHKNAAGFSLEFEEAVQFFRELKENAIGAEACLSN